MPGAGDPGRRGFHALIRGLLAAVTTAMAVVMLFASAQSPTAAYAAGDDDAGGAGDTGPLPREINLVYDDSGSMMMNSVDGKQVGTDRWCQARYAMEVFAAMLAPGDTLNIYTMSDFGPGKTKAGPHLSVKGGDPQDSVAKIHAMITKSSATPFETVVKAERDLAGAGADVEKWLVVLTDGEFQVDGKTLKGKASSDYLDKQFKKYADAGIKVVYLGMGGEAQAVSPIDGKVFPHSAAKSTDILENLTNICNQIFQRDGLPAGSDQTYSWDHFAMTSLFVFAQGSGVSVQGLSSDGQTIAPQSSVPVRYSEAKDAAKGLGAAKLSIIEPTVDRDLQGVVATFTNVPPGTYQLQGQNISNVEVYYQPDATIGMKLIDSGGQDVTDQAKTGKLVGGDYTIDFQFQDTSGQFYDSPLLTDPQFSGTVTSDGQVVKSSLKSGDTVTLQRGDIVVNVTATFNRYGSASSTIDFRSLEQGSPLTITAQPPPGGVSVTSLRDPSRGIVVTVTQGGKPLSEEKWRLTKLQATSDQLVDFTSIAPGPSVSTFVVHPAAPNGDVYAAATGDIRYHLTASLTWDEQLSEGQADQSLTITDDLSIWDRAGNWLSRYGLVSGLILLLLIILLGYTPLFKKRFSKRIGKRPSVDGRPLNFGRPTEAKGSFTKDTLSVILPYKSETATYRYVGRGVRGAASLKLRALKGNRMRIVNMAAFKGKTKITFDGEAIPADQKRPVDISPSTTVSYRDEEAKMLYSSEPTRK